MARAQLQLVADFTDRVHARLRDGLAARHPARSWETEWYARRTPVDVAGVPDNAAASLLLVEVEMRRADPVNNPVKLARYAHEGDFDRDVRLVHLFSDYYALDSGGVSSKRENAAFVGALASDHLDGFAYDALTLDVAPPTHGATPDGAWLTAVDEAAAAIGSLLGE
ncbi:hypothetical protein GCM10009021_09880 [Halarchaeum nitratireducens]|uniref:Uncharacterized protein n=1 Tax=Halarchaeum nitratireducens TaxID=489913 RepID=A0A830G8I6_9EURY|nr:hypothetical protein GCM10009021_09880 [Halarchaeum nitratireducens]